MELLTHTTPSVSSAVLRKWLNSLHIRDDQPKTPQYKAKALIIVIKAFIQSLPQKSPKRDELQSMLFGSCLCLILVLHVDKHLSCCGNHSPEYPNADSEDINRSGGFLRLSLEMDRNRPSREGGIES